MAPGRLPVFGDVGFGGFHQIEDDPAFFQVGLSGAGEGEAAGAAHQKLGAQMAFQSGHLAGDHGAGKAQLLGHGGKAVEFGYPNEDLHGGESVHCCNFGNK